MLHKKCVRSVDPIFWLSYLSQLFLVQRKINANNQLKTKNFQHNYCLVSTKAFPPQRLRYFDGWFAAALETISPLQYFLLFEVTASYTEMAFFSLSLSFADVRLVKFCYCAKHAFYIRFNFFLCFVCCVFSAHVRFHLSLKIIASTKASTK